MSEAFERSVTERVGDVLRAELGKVQLRVSEDPVKVDLELVCDQCEHTICDAEHGDTIALLMSVAIDHLQTCSVGRD